MVDEAYYHFVNDNNVVMVGNAEMKIFWGLYTVQ